MGQASQQAGQGTGQLRFQATNLSIGLNAIKLALSGRIAQQHATQPEPACVLLTAAGQAQLVPMGLIEAPANPSPRHPLRQARHGLCTDAKTPGHSRHIQ